MAQQLWRAQAACRGKDPALWFPPEFDPNERKRETPRLYREAKRICLGCPVRMQCLDYALDAQECCGMWGGLTRPERNTILRLRRQEV